MKKKILLSLLALNIFACSVMGCGKTDEVSTKMMNDIDTIGEVTIEDEETINNLQETYAILTDKQKNQVKNYSKLLEAKEQLDQIVKEQEQTEAEEKERILNIEREYYSDIDAGFNYLKSKCKNPSSLQIYEIVVDAKPIDTYMPATIYYRYSAQNGFGNDVDGIFMYWVGQDIGKEDTEFYDRIKNCATGKSASAHYEIGENFYSTTEEENLDIGEWFFIVDLDDYLTR